MKAPVPARNGGARVVVIRVKLADILRRIGLARVLWPRECGSFALAAGVRSPCVDRQGEVPVQYWVRAGLLDSGAHCPSPDNPQSGRGRFPAPVRLARAPPAFRRSRSAAMRAGLTLQPRFRRSAGA